MIHRDRVARWQVSSGPDSVVLHCLPHECRVQVEGGAGLFGEGSILAGLGELREFVKAAADPGEAAEEGVGSCVVPRPRDRAEGRLADEARRRPPADSGPLGDAGKFLAVEANELGSGTALRHSGLACTEGDRLIVPSYKHLPPLAAERSRRGEDH
jgi:hypothetical protein